MAKEPNTVWRVQEDDIRMVIEDRYPLLTESEVEKAIKISHERFHMNGWQDQVDDFLSVHMDTHIKD